MSEEDYNSITKLDRNMRLYDPAFMEVFGWDNTPYFSWKILELSLVIS